VIGTPVDEVLDASRRNADACAWRSNRRLELSHAGSPVRGGCPPVFNDERWAGGSTAATKKTRTVAADAVSAVPRRFDDGDSDPAYVPHGVERA
jgi:hypothetical protein